MKLLKLTAFLLEKNEQRKIQEIQPEELNRYVSEFILSVKRKDGQDYEPSSLRGLFSSFNRYLKERKYSASIIEDIVFDQARKCLEAHSKQLKKEGKGNKPNAAEALTDVEENRHSLRKEFTRNIKCRSFVKHSVAFQFGAFWLERLCFVVVVFFSFFFFCWLLLICENTLIEDVTLKKKKKKRKEKKKKNSFPF